MKESAANMFFDLDAIWYKVFCHEDGYRPVGKSNFISNLARHYKIFVKRINVGNVKLYN
jgi:hypothetical protein